MGSAESTPGNAFAAPRESTCIYALDLWVQQWRKHTPGGFRSAARSLAPTAAASDRPLRRPRPGSFERRKMASPSRGQNHGSESWMGDVARAVANVSGVLRPPHGVDTVSTSLDAIDPRRQSLPPRSVPC